MRNIAILLCIETEEGRWCDEKTEGGLWRGHMMEDMRLWEVARFCSSAGVASSQHHRYDDVVSC